MAPPNRREKERQKARMLDSRKYLDEHGSEWKPTSFSIPDGIETFRFEEQGLYMIDVVPYVVARHKGEPGGNPFVDEEDVGAMSYERTYYVHAGVGSDEKSYACLHKEFKEDCPGCEYVQELLSNPAIDRKKVVNPRRPKERQLFLFYDRTTKESRKKGLRLYECAHYMSFGELLKTTLEACRLGDPDHPAISPGFADPEDGMSLAITVKKTQFSSDSGRSGTYNKPVNIQFVPRDRALPAEILEAAPCLDDLPVQLSYDKFYKLMHQSDSKKASNNDRAGPIRRIGSVPLPPENDDDDDDSEDQHDDGKPATRKGAPARPPAKDRNGERMVTAGHLGIEKGDEVEYKGEACTVIHVSGDGTSLRLKDSEGEILMGIGVEDVEKSDTDDENNKPSPGKGRSKSQAVPEDEDDDDDAPDTGPEDEDDEDDEDDESPKAASARGAGRKSASATKPSQGSRKAAPPTDDEDDDDDDEDDKPAPSAKKGKGRR